MPRPRIAIAGAGIGGLTAALALARRGFPVALYEQAERLEEAGAGIQLSPNATRILIALGLGPALQESLVEPEAVVLRRGADGREIVRLPLDGARQRWAAPYGVIHRADLQALLLAAIAREDSVTLTLGARVATLSQDEDGVAIGIEQGADRVTARAEALVGADGLWSRVRAGLGRHAPPVFAGKRAWRAVLASEAGPAWLSRPVTTLCLGSQAHLVAYPVRGGRALNLVVIARDGDARAGWSEPMPGDRLAGRLAGWSAEIRAMLGRHEAWRTWPLFEVPSDAAMAQGRVALLGDAAHAMLPFIAQGGGMAIEDAAELAAWLGREEAPISESLAAFSRNRLPRVARVQREARANGARYHWGGALALARDAGLRLVGGPALLSRYDWLYGWTPPA
ncbi:FAD-dependent monooxygenase [Labrys wisconsinensis]|uniref:Salicylate hydroxylase n=1 Tax=Labrys wisconsinensis TaxID=425677 RepID=A0ABU0J4D7_9HYPH|nr:FAD-dependent monooxygenase [Labrys wisconsinensis]MDQ0469136.1 salicylate hydroxylase [Labrys wisconsinensis]